MKKQQALEPAQNTEWLLAAMTQPSSEWAETAAMRRSSSAARIAAGRIDGAARDATVHTTSAWASDVRSASVRQPPTGQRLPRSRGSRTSRRASPKRLKENTSKPIARPG